MIEDRKSPRHLKWLCGNVSQIMICLAPELITPGNVLKCRYFGSSIDVKK